MQTSLLRKAGVAMPAILITFLLALLSTVRAAEQNNISILYYEPIRLTDTPSSGKNISSLTAADETAALFFEAYGRRFELQPDKIRIIAGTKFIQLSGPLAGLPGSWFSLLRDGDELSGIINDGIDTYIVESRRRLTGLLVEAPAGDAPPSVIFRLADTLVPQGLLACEVRDNGRPAGQSGTGSIDGQSAFAKLTAELQAATNNASATGNPFLLVGVVADDSFVSRHANETENDITVIFNTVQGIYANEVGIDIEVGSVFSITPGVVSPFSATLVAPDLLDELSAWRIANQANFGHTHLLTRKRLVDETGSSLAGISFLGQPGLSGVCNRSTGASLSRDIRGLTALIVAHEIGHNLGAPHDGDPAGACALAPAKGFIMSPSISRSTETKFTDCSITQMNKVIQAASCLTEAAQKLPANAGSGGGGGGALSWFAITGLLFSVLLRPRRVKDGARFFRSRGRSGRIQIFPPSGHGHIEGLVRPDYPSETFSRSRGVSEG